MRIACAHIFGVLAALLCSPLSRSTTTADAALTASSLHASAPRLPDPLPPAVLYHFGQRGLLVEDAKADTIPLQAWERFIMGGATTFKSHPFRRGLYGTVHPAFADNFGEWFMAVHVSDRCRTAESVVTPSDLFNDQRFEAWLATRADVAVADFTRRCSRASTALEGSTPRLILQVDNLPESRDREAGYCETLLDRFYTETGAKVILDEQWLEQEQIGINLLNRVSWYIRDRSCIDAIDGEETDVVRMLAEVPALWDDHELVRINPEELERVEASRAIGRAHPLRMLLIGLAAFPESASEQHLVTIRQASEDGYAPLAPLTEGAQALVPPVIDAFRRCRVHSRIASFLKEIPAGDFDLTLIPEIVDRLRGVCLPSGHAF